LQYRCGIPLGPVNSVTDKILTKCLINERVSMNLGMIMLLTKEQMKPKDLLDTFQEFYYRNFNRDHVYRKEKAKDTINLANTLAEAKQIMGK
jgi:hypothetical protein